MIVGFPGETESDFEDTMDACRKIGFSKIHMFPFSPRRGTPAADMTDQIEKSVKRERGRVLLDLESELKEKYFNELVGQQLQLLIEKVEQDGSVSGTSCRYAQIRVPGSNLVQLDGNLTSTRTYVENALVDVTIQGVDQNALVGCAI